MQRLSLSASTLLVSVFFNFFIANVQADLAPVPVSVMSASWQDYSRPIRISGILENKSEQNLAFKISGLIRHAHVSEGQWVKENQVLATLDLEEINAQVAKAESVLANAERNLERFLSLRTDNAVSDEQLQAVETQVEVARSDLRVAKFNQRHAVIRAPADGRILKKFIESNEMAAPGAPAYVFAPRKSGWVLRAGVTDKDIVRLSLNDKASVKFDAYEDAIFKARINELAARADASHTFGVELLIEDESSSPLLAGFVGHAIIEPEHTRRVMLLPTAAMVQAHRGNEVRQKGIHSEVDIFVVNKSNQAQMRRVVVIALDNQLVVSSGLTAGELVVVQGAAYLSSGRAVTVAAQE